MQVILREGLATNEFYSNKEGNLCDKFICIIIYIFLLTAIVENAIKECVCLIWSQIKPLGLILCFIKC